MNTTYIFGNKILIRTISYHATRQRTGQRQGNKIDYICVKSDTRICGSTNEFILSTKQI